MLYWYHQLKYSSSKPLKKTTTATQKTSENYGLGKKSQENGPKATKDKTERATGLGRRGDRPIEKWDQTESPEIPDRGETSEIPRLPFGGGFTSLHVLLLVTSCGTKTIIMRSKNRPGSSAIWLVHVRGGVCLFSCVCVCVCVCVFNLYRKRHRLAWDMMSSIIIIIIISHLPVLSSICNAFKVPL